MLVDLDGTLVDSAASIERSWRRWAGQHSKTYESLVGRLPGRTAAEVIDMFLDNTDRATVQSEEQKLLDWQSEDSNDVTAIAGADRFLSSIPDDRVAIVTACDRRLATARLRAAGLRVPSLIIGCHEVERGKPEPDGFLLAADLLGFDARRCLVVEDSPAGVASGQQAGSPVLKIGPEAIRSDLSADDFSGVSIEIDKRSELPIRVTAAF